MQDGSGGMGMLMWVWLAVVLICVVGIWMVFTKAGKPGWASIIPIYNLFVLIDIVGKPWWWVLLFLIPVVNFIIAILVAVALAERFGKGVGYAIGLIFLPFIFYPMLGFSDAKYTPAPGH
jgi:hypothetical protein